MTQEEKAKKYDEALEWMGKVYPTLTGVDKEDAEHYFPELKESKDERIRKVLVSIVKWLGFDSSFFTDNSVTKSEVLAYLEKQKEQKPVEWSEDDKFKLEDAITGIDIGIGFYETEGKHPNLLKAFIEAKEWLKSLPERFNLQPKPEWSEEDEEAMKELLKILDRRELLTSDDAPWLSNWLKSIPERFNLQPKQEWSEEDLQHKSWILECLADGKRKMPEYAEDFRAAYKWLKSIHPQPKVEWSEEDKHRCKDAIYFLETAKKHYASTSEIELTIEWLKSLQPQAKQEQKEQTTLEYLPKEKINDIISKLTNLSFRKLIPYDSKEYKKIKEIRTNVRDLLDYPIEKKHWEPNEEQMKALSDTIAFAPDTFKPKCTLVTLQDDLKKLMEE